MKTFKIFIIIAVLFSSLSCNKWFDVTPSTEMKADVLFSNQAGFRDALIGVYALMCDPNSYGSELTMGYMDVLAQTYSNVRSNVNHSYVNAGNYRYTELSEEQRLTKIWKQQYKAIANVNILLEKADEKKAIFSGHNYKIIKGEALALRAFLHFDLLRMFGPLPHLGLDAKAIPYVNAHTNVPFAQSSIKEVVQQVIKDLEDAQSLLKDADPLGPQVQTSNSTSLSDGNRQVRMNYYAASALMARAYLYINEKEKALDKAKEVIDSKQFPLFTSSAATQNEDYIFPSEHIFSLTISDLKTRFSDRFFPEVDHATNPVALTISNSHLTGIFPGGLNTDYRNNWLATASSSSKRLTKYAYNTFIPLIKVSEIYLIAAEAERNLQFAIEKYLNKLKIHRGLSELDAHTTTEEMLKIEIADEYRREFIGEGQLFYYFKRLNVQKLPTIPLFTDSKQVYELPLPSNEIEFGKIN